MDTKKSSVCAYEQYIHKHIKNVHQAFKEYGTELCAILNADKDTVQYLVEQHDKSKFTLTEFDAYRAKFYPIHGERVDEVEFAKAWLHHIHHNMHHPEYWSIVKIPRNDILSMPPIYIAEMLCDWQSFKYGGKGSAYDFYYNIDNKTGLLSDKTRELVEKALEIFKEDKDEKI